MGDHSEKEQDKFDILRNSLSNIEKDFNFKNNKRDIIELKFLKKISKTPVYISRKTGLIFHNTFSSIKIVKEWSNRIFSNKMGITKKGYSPLLTNDW